MITLLLLISHTISDFIIQTNSIVSTKENFKLKGYLYHGLALLLTSFPVLIFIKFKNYSRIIPLIMLVILIHISLDYIKEVILKNLRAKDISEVWNAFIFLIDQLFHISFIVLITYQVNLEYNIMNQYILNAFFLEQGLSYYNIKKVFVIIYISFSGSYFVPLLFNVVYEKVDNYSDRLNKILKKEEDLETHDFIDEVKTGKWIGIFERIIILILIFSNQFSSIGFVIAIKSFARFKLMDNKIFSEYYLLGTLFSLVYTLIGYGFFKLII